MFRNCFLLTALFEILPIFFVSSETGQVFDTRRRIAGHTPMVLIGCLPLLPQQFALLIASF